MESHPALSSHEKPPVIETHGGIDVVREDLFCPELPSGKVRGLVPYFAALAARGVTTVVNHATSYSNSHGIVGYCAGRAGLHARSYVNCRKPSPQTDFAVAHGCEVVFAGPLHLAPLRTHMGKMEQASDQIVILPWGLPIPGALRHIAALVDLVGVYGYHVVPFGAGGYTHAVADGIAANRARMPVTKVVAVPGESGVGAAYKRFNALRPPRNISIVATGKQEEPPFPCDPHYEWWAWPEALRLRAAGHSVLFWSVGVPLS